MRRCGDTDDSLRSSCLLFPYTHNTNTHVFHRRIAEDVHGHPAWITEVELRRRLLVAADVVLHGGPHALPRLHRHLQGRVSQGLMPHHLGLGGLRLRYRQHVHYPLTRDPLRDGTVVRLKLGRGFFHASDISRPLLHLCRGTKEKARGVKRRAGT